MFSTVIILAVIGLIISIYGITIERKLQQDSQYKAACDISDNISCTRPFLSEYGKMFGISNIWASAMYYVAVIVTALINMPLILLLITSAGAVVSFVFAYILYFKVKSLCLICTSLYIVNIALAITCYYSYFA
jgi:vitamin-K-epoxide reductase (warfarin-sensitive)